MWQSPVLSGKSVYRPDRLGSEIEHLCEGFIVREPRKRRVARTFNDVEK